MVTLERLIAEVEKIPEEKREEALDALKSFSASNSEKSIMEKLRDLSFAGGPADLSENHDDYVLGIKP